MTLASDQKIKVPLLDLRAQYKTIEEDINNAIRRVLESQVFIMGPEVNALEEEIANFVGGGTAIGVSSGTDALLVALMALGVGPGDEVITTTYSFFATAGVISRLGAKPVFVDIDAETFNLRPDQVAAKIGPRTKVIMPVHLFGRCAEMGDFLSIAEQHGLPVVEDAAQAIACRDSEGFHAGTRGSIGCFSFFPSKNLGGYGDGGIVVANDADLAERIKILRVHGSKPKYYHSVVGGNFRLDAIQAAVVRVKLKHLERWTEQRRRNADRYRRLFSDAGLSDVGLPKDVPGHGYNQFVIRAERRDDLRRFLAERDVGTEVYYPVPLHVQACFKELGYQKGDLPESERAADGTLALPIYPELTEDQLTYVVESIIHFYRG